MTNGMLIRDSVIESSTEPLPPPIAAALDILATSIDNSPGLSPLGEISAMVELGHCVDVGSALARAELERSSASAATSLGPVIIGGLPRTGTSLLHGLLAEACPSARTLTIGEVYDPFAGLSDARDTVGFARAQDEAAEASRLRYESLHGVAPEFYSLHPLGPQYPEECTPLLQASLRCLQMHIMFPVRDYAEWVLTAPGSYTYSLWDTALCAITTCDHAPSTLLLKSPVHVMDYASLTGVAPGSRLIQIVRDPEDAWSSFVELVTTARSIFCCSSSDDVVDDWRHIWSVLVARATEASEIYPSDRLLSVPYGDLITRPIETTARIAEWVGLAIDYNELPLRLQLASERTATRTSPPLHF